ncbi:PTS sugar transporter subunit IIA [Helcococcus sueciensis]|uniref:PTS sugar transporter subunit IIA n=1 Tax=Helcococcus sueciensis TaxID=241555 RepID=UPI000408276A|nr:PTS sugar transporter subunit IIA [Helcococcus sueciensis]
MANILFEKENVFLNQQFLSKEEAIKFAGKKLQEAGYVTEEYTESMLNREEILTTYIDNEIALPHGDRDSSKYTLKTGVVFIQAKIGVDFGNDDVAKLIFASAGIGNDHLKILSSVAKLSKDLESINELKKTDDSEIAYDLIQKYIK